MSILDLDKIKEFLSSNELEHYSILINELCNSIIDVNETLFKDFRDNPSLIKADLFYKYLSISQGVLEKQIESETNDDVIFYLILFTYSNGDKSSIKKLLPYAKSNNIEKSLQSINRLSKENVEELKPILEDKLQSANFNEANYIIALLQAAKKLNMELPVTFIKNIPKEIPWGLKATLKHEFGILS